MALHLQEFHQRLGARFGELNGAELVLDYHDRTSEYAALQESAGVLDLSFRGRLCLVGADRIRFLHGQVTNDVKRLQPGQGCYAALVTAKGKMESDLNIHCLADELLLDFEPGFAQKISDRLEKHIVADDVQVVDVAPLYGLISVQGPKSTETVSTLGLFSELPMEPFHSRKCTDPRLGEICLINQARLGTTGFDLFAPVSALHTLAERILTIAKTLGGRLCGWSAFETARIERGIPRFGQDMDEGNIPLECGIETRAVSYSKGCYIGQEVINRIHTIGHVNRELRGLHLPDNMKVMPARGDKLFRDGKEVGHVTSAVASPALNTNIALGYVRHEAGAAGMGLQLRTAAGEQTVRVQPLPFTSG